MTTTTLFRGTTPSLIQRCIIHPLFLFFAWSFSNCIAFSPSFPHLNKKYYSPIRLTFKNPPQQQTSPIILFQSFKTAQEESSQIAVESTALQKYKLTPHILKIHQPKTDEMDDNVLIAEIFTNGELQLAILTQLLPPSSRDLPPLLEVATWNSGNVETQVIDLGQITTIWDNRNKDDDDEKILSLSPTPKTTIHQILQSLQSHPPIPPIEKPLQTLYNSRVGRGRRSSRETLTKKQINAITNPNLQSILRKANKAGYGMMRLVHSFDVIPYLFPDSSVNDHLEHRLIAAKALSADMKLGGKFKRHGCIFVSAQYRQDDAVVESITLLNGGYIAVDSSSRAGTEARKFVNRQDDFIITEADTRIVYRLECLAMGEGINWDEKGLELDVREVLNQMKLEITPKGAKEALLRVGKWSGSDAIDKVEPWSESILVAAKEFANYQRGKRTQFDQNQNKQQQPRRIDLTNLPCVTIDAKSTSFRDDAIGIRPRSQTGRKVLPKASKWEVLIHVTDVSDIYTTHSPFIKADTLRQAAASRGVSRYDLPFGPLHLLPPVALQSLSLQKDEVNECVTLWAYIDEQSGKLIDVGLERSVLSSPMSFTYQSATSLLKQNTSSSSSKTKAKALLSVVERNLTFWSRHFYQTNPMAQKRQQRLEVKEVISNEISSDKKYNFERSRGHKLIDMALELYAHGVHTLLKKKNVSIPKLSRSATRLGTAPLRRYIDGMTQRQALAALCNYGQIMSREECFNIYQMVGEASDAVSNYRSLKQKNQSKPMIRREEENALRKLKGHLEQVLDGRRKIVHAISTGRENEVVILGNGAVAKCRGVKGSLKPGQKIMVEVVKIVPEKGILSVKLIE